MATHPPSTTAASPIFPEEGFARQAPEAIGTGSKVAASSALEISAEEKLVSQGPIGKRFEELLATVSANRPSEDLAPIRKAWEFCVHYHEGQLRASGEPYIIHPLEVAEGLAEVKLDATAIAAGLLHDAVEDTPVTSEEIATAFGEQVAHIVEGVTKIDKIQFANREDRQAANARHMLPGVAPALR